MALEDKGLLRRPVAVDGEVQHLRRQLDGAQAGPQARFHDLPKSLFQGYLAAFGQRIAENGDTEYARRLRHFVIVVAETVPVDANPRPSFEGVDAVEPGPR